MHCSHVLKPRLIFSPMGQNSSRFGYQVKIQIILLLHPILQHQITTSFQHVAFFSFYLSSNKAPSFKSHLFSVVNCVQASHISRWFMTKTNASGKQSYHILFPCSIPSFNANIQTEIIKEIRN